MRLSCRRIASVLWLTALFSSLLVPARAQSPQWRVHFAGGGGFGLSTPHSVDSLNTVVEGVVDSLRREGYYMARLDSVRADTADRRQAIHLYLTRGPEVLVGEVQLAAGPGIDLAGLRPLLATRAGRPLDRTDVERDVEVLLAHLEQSGYPLAQVRVERIDLVTDEGPHLDVLLRIDAGQPLELDRVEVAGDARTRASFLARMAGVRPGSRITAYDPGSIGSRLRSLPYFEDVGEPELTVDADGKAVLRIPVKEAPPGTFDLVLGYQPSTGGGKQGSFVGTGRLELLNVLGQGRELGLRLHQLPGQASRFEANVADPFVAGLPLSLAAHFEGIQQDSTFGKRSFGARLGYRLHPTLEAHAMLTREVTRPGRAGLGEISRANALFAGVGLAWRRLNRSINPSRGIYLYGSLEQGRKEGDASQNDGMEQLRARLTARAYLPTAARQVVVFGGDGWHLISDAYDRSDLFRFGGASTLRGYDEERFLAATAVRALAEYRYQLDVRSYAYAFLDVGYVNTPVGHGVASENGVFPGYGVGAQYGTGVGLLNMSVSINPEDGPSAARIHAGMSLGL